MRALLRPYHRQAVWKKAVVVGVVVTFLGMFLDIAFHGMWFNTLPFTSYWWAERVWENVIQGVCFGIIGFIVIRDRERQLQRRFHEVAYLNHHIRNALSSIVLCQNAVTETQQRIEMVREASDRIQRCLERISRHDDCDLNKRDPREP